MVRLTRYADLRREYADGGLAEDDLAADPFAMFQRWYDDAVAAEIYEPNAMVVASVVRRRPPVARMVLLKGLTPRVGVLHQPRLAQGRPSCGTNPGRAAVPRGTRWSGRCASRVSPSG